MDLLKAFQLTSMITSMRGITLFELLIVLGLAGIIARFTVFDSISAYRGILASTDADRLTSFLETARTSSLQSICHSSDCEKSSHGGFIGKNKAIAFEGSSYAHRLSEYDELYSLANLSSTDPNEEIVYTEGRTTKKTNINLLFTEGPEWSITASMGGGVLVTATSSRVK